MENASSRQQELEVIAVYFSVIMYTLNLNCYRIDFEVLVFCKIFYLCKNNPIYQFRIFMIFLVTFY